MDCSRTRRFLVAYADGELDVTANLEVAGHVRACAACARIVADHRLLRGALHRAVTSEALPAALLPSIRSAIAAESRTAAARRGPLIRPWLAIAAAIVLGFGLPWTIWMRIESRPSAVLFAREFTRDVANHHAEAIRVLSSGAHPRERRDVGTAAAVRSLGVMVDAFTPNLAGHGMSLDALQVCELSSGERGVAALYRDGGAAALSLFSILRRQADVADAPREQLTARYHVETIENEAGDFAVVGWNNDPAVGVPTSYLACARMPADQLLQFVTSVRWENAAPTDPALSGKPAATEPSTGTPLFRPNTPAQPPH